MVGDKVSLRHTAFKGKCKIQDHWEDTIYELVEQPFENMPVFKIKSQGDDNRVKMVYRNLLLLLLSEPLDCAGELNKSRSLADPKETMGAQMAIVVSAIASHVQNLSAYEGSTGNKHDPEGTEVCYNSVSEMLRSTESIHSESI